MAYTPTNWVDVPEGTTPPPGAPQLSAANLNKLEQAVAALSGIGTSGMIQVGGAQPSEGWWLDTGTAPEPDVEVTPTGPTWTDDTVNGGGTWTTPTQAGITYSPASGTADPGQLVTVTATALPGYVIIGGTSSWAHTFPTGPAAEPDWATLLASDDFERADTSPTVGTLGTAPTGGTWDDPTPAFYIAGGRALTTTNGAFATLPAASAVKASAIVHFTTATTATTGVVARASTGSTATFYEARFASTAVRLYRFVDGTATPLGDPHSVTLTTGTTRAIALRVWESGGATELRVDLDGTQVITATDAEATRPVGTRAGIRGQSNSARFDSFTANA